ncbi:Nicotinate phosphoribosyltransferase [Chlamydiales bacterium STE3]|nr:Nicotinate phosphoribosyltransferase [Chlamydiales bacterium STE3]
MSKLLSSQSLALMTDFYQLSMSYGYWKADLHNKEAVFQLFFRKTPFKGGFTITSGLESVIDFLENFRFDESDLSYLRNLRDHSGHAFFCDEFFDYLSTLKFTCHVDAIPEGTVVFPYEPLLRIQGPLLQCQILESPLLNLINFPSLIATKAARVCLAAGEDPVFEFGLRRAQGVDGALTASRAAYVGGCHATSNVLAGKLFGIPVSGTHSHSWVMVFADELEAFKTYSKSLPGNCVFLVDTYNSIEGIKKAIEVGTLLKQNGQKLLGIRLDSGDLAYLSLISRKMLDERGFKDCKIYASNELDETVISELKRQGAKIDVWGVGTNLVTGKEQSALDGVYKLSAIRDENDDWRYTLKLSEQMLKVSNPGILQVRRFKKNSEFIADAIYDIQHSPQGDFYIVDPFDPTREKVMKSTLEFEDLLVPIFRQGKRVYNIPSLEEVRRKTKENLSFFYPGVKRFLNPHQYVVGMERKIYEMKIELIKHIRNQTKC